MARRKLALGTAEQARKTLARLIRLYDGQEISENALRAHVYALGKLLDYFKLEHDVALEERLDEMERRLEEFKQRGRT